MGGVTIVRADGDPDQPKDGELVADRRLYVNAAKTRLIEESDPSAAFLLVGEGGRIGKGDVQRLGLELVDGRVVQAPIEKAEPVAPALELEQPPVVTPPPVVDGDAKSDDEKQPAGGDSSAAAT